jgi:hypothetical protein
MKKFIYEMVIYDGGMKNWRVLNLNSGSFYCTSYDSEQKARDSIEEGEERAGRIVRRIELQRVQELLDANPPLKKTLYGQREKMLEAQRNCKPSQ